MRPVDTRRSGSPDLGRTARVPRTAARRFRLRAGGAGEESRRSHRPAVGWCARHIPRCRSDALRRSAAGGDDRAGSDARSPRCGRRGSTGRDRGRPRAGGRAESCTPATAETQTRLRCHEARTCRSPPESPRAGATDADVPVPRLCNRQVGRESRPGWAGAVDGVGPGWGRAVARARLCDWGALFRRLPIPCRLERARLRSGR